MVESQHLRLALVIAGVAAMPLGCRNTPDVADRDAPSAARGVVAVPQAAAPPPPLPAAPPGEAASDIEHAFERASQVIAPSVVSIRSVRTFRRPLDDEPFGDLLPGPWPRGELRQQGVGSGVIVGADGHILTNNHVVHGADAIEVVLHDDRTLTGEVIGGDPHTDIAVVKVAAEGLTPAALGDSELLKVGQWVLAAGSPFGLQRTISAGIVSAIGRANMGITDYEQFIQTDAAINPGNSGGPLIDLRGRVVGINTAIASSSGANTGVGFAVPVNMARRVMEQIMRGGAVVRGWLGVMIGPLTPELARSFGYEDGRGILVQEVLAVGPAGQAGLMNGDIIVERDGKPVKDAAEFRAAIAQTPPGTRIALKVWRSGQIRAIDVTLGELPDPQGQVVKPAAPGLGLKLGELNEMIRERFDIERERGAVVLDVAPGSPAEDAGLRPGDVIEQIGDDPVETAAEASRRLTASAVAQGVRIRVRRGDRGRYTVLRSRLR